MNFFLKINYDDKENILFLSLEKNKSSKNKKSLQFPNSEEPAETQDSQSNSQGKSSLCTTNSTKEELVLKLNAVCSEKNYELKQGKDNGDSMTFVCSKESNYVGIEIKKIGRNNVLFLKHMNGNIDITKEIIKILMINVGF